MTIKDFHIAEDSRAVSWIADGQVFWKQYPKHIHAVALNDALGVLVVEPSDFPDNAVIYNADGTNRLRISNPLRSRGALCFSECGYEGSDLTLIIRTAGGEFAYVIDELGRAKRLSEIR